MATINGTAGNDNGTAGNGPALIGTYQNDIINAGDGDDFVDGRSGLDTMDGGDGIDTLDVTFFNTGSYVLNMNTGLTNWTVGSSQVA